MRCSVHGTDHVCVRGVASASEARFRDIIGAFRTITFTPRYAVLAVTAALVLFVLAVYLSMGPFVPQLLASRTYDLAGKVIILVTAIGNFRTNFSLMSEITTVCIAALGGYNIAMSVYILRRRVASGTATGAGLVGTFAGMLGAGCSACGSILLSSLLGTGSTAAVVGVLPFGGHTIGVVGLLILVIATAVMAPNVVRAPVCAVRRIK